MNFKSGRLDLFSPKVKSGTYWPLGPPSKKIHGNHVIIDGKPTIEFKQNRFSTTKADIARGLVSDETNFEKHWGYGIVPTCLPADIAGIYAEATIDSKRLIALALVDGKSPDQIIEELDIELKSEQLGSGEDTTDGRPENLAIEHYCPVPGCRKKIAEGPDSREIMNKHVRQAHPDWTGEADA